MYMIFEIIENEKYTGTNYCFYMGNICEKILVQTAPDEYTAKELVKVYEFANKNTKVHYYYAKE